MIAIIDNSLNLMENAKLLFFSHDYYIDTDGYTEFIKILLKQPSPKKEDPVCISIVDLPKIKNVVLDH